jgi:hypothetical protein
MQEEERRKPPWPTAPRILERNEKDKGKQPMPWPMKKEKRLRVEPA